MNNESVFRYSYSAKQIQEVQAIRNNYIPQPESKLDELKRLDQLVNHAGMAQALAIGILGCLVFGLGMCFAVQVIGQSVALGAFIGVWGAAAIIAAYPVYRTIFKKAKAKYQPRILELAAELCGETSEF